MALSAKSRIASSIGSALAEFNNGRDTLLEMGPKQMYDRIVCSCDVRKADSLTSGPLPMKLTYAVLFVAIFGFSATISGVAAAQSACDARCEMQRVNACPEWAMDGKSVSCRSKAWDQYYECRAACSSQQRRKPK